MGSGLSITCALLLQLCLSKVNLSGNNVKEVNISQLGRLTHKKQKEAKLCIHEPNPSLFLFLNIQTEHIS